MPRIPQPAEMMIDNLCNKLKYPDMFIMRKLPRPSTPPCEPGKVRVIENISGIIYDFKLRPKKETNPTSDSDQKE